MRAWRKPVIITICAMIVLAAVLLLQYQEKAARLAGLAEDPYRIMVVTDPHYLSPELTDGGEYFTNLIESGDGKAIMYSEEIADAMIRVAATEKPDLLIVAGDLTFNGELQSLEDLTKKLRTLPGQGTGVLVIPGNHDTDSDMAARFQGNGYEPAEAVSAGTFDDICYGLSTGQAVARDTGSLSYVYESARGLRLLMLDVNANGTMGAVTEETLSWVERQLRAARRDGLPVIAVSHQNLLAHNRMFTEGFTINGAQRLAELYRKYGVLCNLSGHMHTQHIVSQDLSGSGVPEIVTGAASMYPHYYGMLVFDGTALDYEAKPLRVGEDPKGFAEWSEKFFEDCSRRGFEEAVKEAEGSPEEPVGKSGSESSSSDGASAAGTPSVAAERQHTDAAEATEQDDAMKAAAAERQHTDAAEATEQDDAMKAAAAYARLNRLYYEGRTDRFGKIAGLDTLQRYLEETGLQDSLAGYFIRSILQEEPKDHRKTLIRVEAQ